MIKRLPSNIYPLRNISVVGFRRPWQLSSQFTNVFPVKTIAPLCGTTRTPATVRFIRWHGSSPGRRSRRDVDENKNKVTDESENNMSSSNGYSWPLNSSESGPPLDRPTPSSSSSSLATPAASSPATASSGTSASSLKPQNASTPSNSSSPPSTSSSPPTPPQPAPPHTSGPSPDLASNEHTYIHRWRTKQELLEAANGFFERFRIRFKWTLLRQVRPFNTDDISAFFSWILVGNIIWFLVGTTTFCSLVLLALNTVTGQDFLARWVGNLITKETGIKVVFESAIVPHWNEGVISFRKVFVSRRPGRKTDKHNRVKIGSQQQAASEAAALLGTASPSDPSKLSAVAITDPSSSDDEGILDDGNYTQYDLTIDTVSVTLSLARWIDGKGILKHVEVKGLRGVVDRRQVHFIPDSDPKEHKNKYRKGDFELESFKMEDATVTLYQPGDNVEPFEVSIFSCDLPQLRKHWLLYDFMSANNVSGSYDNSLFTVHSKQHRPYGYEDENQPDPWKRISRLRIDNVDIKHLNRGVEGPFGWIENGTVDMLADVMLPNDEEQFTLTEVVRDIVERWEANVNLRNQAKSPSGSSETASSSSESSTGSSELPPPSNHKYVVIDLRVQLNNPRAAVPLFTSDLTYINNALIHPIVGYINSRETYIPVNCRIVKRLSDFEGSWTIYDSELMDDISAELYDAFVANIADDEMRARRMRKVGFWSLQFAAQLVLLGLGVLA